MMDQDQELEAMLVNWGRWSRDTPHGATTSSLYRVIKALEYMYGKPAQDLECVGGEKAPCAPIDEKQAMMVNEALLKLPDIRYDDRRGKLILMTKYLKPWISLKTICRQADVRLKTGKDELQLAKSRLKDILFPQHFHDEYFE